MPNKLPLFDPTYAPKQSGLDRYVEQQQRAHSRAPHMYTNGDGTRINIISPRAKSLWLINTDTMLDDALVPLVMTVTYQNIRPIGRHLRETKC